jgi:hypothetical protein
MLLKLNLLVLEYYRLQYPKLLNLKLQEFNLNKILLLHMQGLTFAFCFCSE